MNENTLKGKWKEIKGEMQEMWGNITGDEFEQTKGNAKSLVGLIQQKLGIAQDEAKAKLQRITDKYQEEKFEASEKVERVKEQVADTVNNSIDKKKAEIRQDIR